MVSCSCNFSIHRKTHKLNTYIHIYTNNDILQNMLINEHTSYVSSFQQSMMTLEIFSSSAHFASIIPHLQVPYLPINLTNNIMCHSLLCKCDPILTCAIWLYH